MSDTTAQPKKKRKMLTSFSIIFILLALVAIISILLNGTSFHYEDIQGTVTGATLGSFTMASICIVANLAIWYWTIADKFSVKPLRRWPWPDG